MPETERILRAYGNHPSFCLLSHGNEPPGGQEKYLGEWVRHWQKLDPRRVYTSGSGWPAIPENDYHVTPSPRIQASGAGPGSRVNARPPETTPTTAISSPNIQTAGRQPRDRSVVRVPEFRGDPEVHGRNLGASRDLPRQPRPAPHGRQAHDFLIASGKLQTLPIRRKSSRPCGQGLRRLPALGPARLPGTGHGPGRRARSVLGEQGLRHAGGVPPFRLRDGAVGADGQAGLDHNGAIRGPGRDFPLRPVAAEGCRGRVGDYRERRPQIASGRLPPQAIPLGNGTPLGEVSLPLAGVHARRS